MLETYQPFFVILAVIAAIIVTKAFFTFWAPVDRKMNGDRREPKLEIKIEQLRDARVSVVLKSGRRIEQVTLRGLCSLHPQVIYPQRHILELESPDNTHYYVAISEVEYIEKCPA